MRRILGFFINPKCHSVNSVNSVNSVTKCHLDYKKEALLCPYRWYYDTLYIYSII